jgi:putative transposase
MRMVRRLRSLANVRRRFGYRRRLSWRVVIGSPGLRPDSCTGVPASYRDGRAFHHWRKRSNPERAWAMDFVHDQLATGRQLRVLTVVDMFSRFSPVLEPSFTFSGADVVEVLEEVGRQVGDSRRRSGSIKAPSSSRVIWTCGLLS